jgi:hypothetical protein
MRNHIYRLLVVTLTLLLFSVSFPQSAYAATINVPADFGTIQQAINTASAGDTIEIAAGTYNENITINKQLTIQGAGTSTIIQATGNVVTIAATGSGSTLRDLQIQNGSRGINIQGGANNITIENVTSTGNYSAGINIANSNGVTIRNSSFINNLNANVPPTAGIGLRMGTGESVENLLIEDSHFDGNYQGIYVSVNRNTPPSKFNQVTIRRTTFNNNHIKGIYLEKASNVVFESIEVNNSGHHATYQYNAGIDFNLLHHDYENITIRDSIITNSGHRNAAIIFKARQGYNNDDTAIPKTLPPTFSSLQDILIENTQIIDNPNRGIVFGGEGEALPNSVITSSYIYGNGTGLTSWIPNLNATNNWWGCNDPSDPTAGCDTIITAPATTVDSSGQIILTSTITPISGGTCQLDLNFTQNVNGVVVPVTWRDGLAVTLSIADGTIASSATFSGGQISEQFTTSAGVPTTITAELDGEQLQIPVTCGVAVDLNIVNVLDAGGNVLNGAVYVDNVESISVRFDTPVFVDAVNHPDSAINPDNYVLLAGASPSTTSCLAGVDANDTRITPTNVTYDNATNAVTLSFNPALSIDDYTLIVCATTSIVSALDTNVHLNGGTDVFVNFSVVGAPSVPVTPTVQPTGVPTQQTPAPQPAPTQAQPEDLGVTKLPDTGETPLWAELIGRFLGR